MKDDSFRGMTLVKEELEERKNAPNINIENSNKG